MKSNFLNKQILATTFFMFFMAISNVALAGNGETNSVGEMAMYLIIVGGVIIAVWAMGNLLNLLNVMVRMRELKIYEKHGLDEFIKRKESYPGSIWQQIARLFSNAVPVEKEADILLDHNYDGIRELDNNLPPWWVYGFYLTIIIGVVYFVYHHFTDFGKSSTELYAMEMAAADEAVRKYRETQADQVDENNVTVLLSEADLEAGKVIFAENCVACHLESGAGSPTSVGPNLTDEYWIHGGGIKNVFKTIKYGVPEKGMISWATQLRPSDMHKVASYVLSLQGTNPPIARDPQGELYVETDRDVDSAAMEENTGEATETAGETEAEKANQEESN